MKFIKLFEELITEDEIEDYLLDIIDYNDDISILSKDQNDLENKWNQTFSYGFSPCKNLFINSKKVPKFDNGDWKDVITSNPNIKEKFISIRIDHPKNRCKSGNLHLEGYTIDMLSHLFESFVKRYNGVVNIRVKIKETNMYDDPLSISIIKVEFVND